MNPKVLHVIARMNVGGTARYVATLVENIPNSYLATGFTQGDEIEDAAIERISPIRINHLGRKISPINDLIAYFELKKLIKSLKPDIVHSHTFKAGLISRLLRGKHKKIHTYHGHLFEDNSFSSLEKNLIKATERYLANKSDLLISVGERVGEQLRELGIGKNKNWVSIAPGVSPLPKSEKIKARKELGLKTNNLIIGWLARVTSVKNPFLFIDIAKNLPKINFALAGGGDLLDEIKVKAPKNVQILGWTDASLFWSAIDLAVSTSDNEGMPIALIEAQLAGIPVVATDVGSTSEVIENQVTGLITSKNLNLMLGAIENIINDPAKFNKMSTSAVSRAKLHFSVENMIAKHKKAYLSA